MPTVLKHACWPVIRQPIDEALIVEWQNRWNLADMGCTLFVLLDCVEERRYPKMGTIMGRWR